MLSLSHQSGSLLINKLIVHSGEPLYARTCFRPSSATVNTPQALFRRRYLVALSSSLLSLQVSSLYVESALCSDQSSIIRSFLCSDQFSIIRSLSLIQTYMYFCSQYSM